MEKGKKTSVMALTKRGVLYVSTIVLLISALLLIALPTSPAEAEAGTDIIGAKFDNLTILHIGGGTPASQLVDRFEETKGQVVSSSDIPEAVELNPEVVIIFGGEWFEQRIYDTKLHDFLRVASSQGAKLVMVGGTTSKFFEALDKAGVYEIPITETGVVRNPAQDNPPLVGLKMKTVDGHTGPSFLFSYERIPDVLEEALIEWLSSTTETETVLGAPYRKFIIEYYYAPLVAQNPYGKLNLIVPIYKLKSDGVTTYDWYFYQLKIQSVPGRVCYGSDYNNEHTWANQEVGVLAGQNRWFVDYDPTTTSGASTAGVSLSAAAGPSGPSVGFTWSWSYSIADVAVLDGSDFSEHRVYWEHDIDRAANVGYYTYLAKPGLVEKTRQGYWSRVDASYEVRFVHKAWCWGPWCYWSGKTLESPTLKLDAREYGD